MNNAAKHIEVGSYLNRIQVWFAALFETRTKVSMLVGYKVDWEGSGPFRIIIGIMVMVEFGCFGIRIRLMCS